MSDNDVQVKVTHECAVCNMCGLSCMLRSDPYHDCNGLLNSTVQGGYESTPGNGSGALDDMTRYMFSLCEWCLDDMFQKFKIPPRVQDYHSDVVEPYVSAPDRVVNESWRRGKEEFFAEHKRRHIARNSR